MANYKEYVGLSKSFKSSVNLLYDLNNHEKIINFIPTTDLCDVIKDYLKCVLGKCDFRSTFLEGPYGKGKSYLLAIICFLISDRKDKEALKILLDRIRIIDIELYELINELEKKKIKLLPIIINNNYYDDLNKNFLMSIKNALEVNGLNDIVPKSSFNEALDVVSVWKNNANTDLRIEECCKNPIINTSLDIIENQIRNYDINGYHKFLDLFSCINHGVSFKTYITDDIVPVYSDVLNQIKAKGYAGIFIVFDEFGSFLENQTSDFSLRLNKIQNLSEFCNNSSQDAQMHFCCIIHKDLSLYSKDKNIIDRFKQISGRFKQIRFDRSLDENYQLICSAIEKNEKYEKYNADFIKAQAKFINGLYESGLFYDKAQVDYIIKNGFPFNPVTLFALVHISEKIAQNERTLFTYLSDSSESGFRFFINNKSFADGLLNVDLIYDYFADYIKTNEDYSSIYYKVESLKRYIYENDSDNGLDLLVHKILKAIAVIKIINDDVKYTSSIKNIALSLNAEEKLIADKIEFLINSSILKKNINDDTIDFEIIADSYLNKMISEVVETKYASIDVSDLLEKFEDSKYFVSHEYNFNTKMTRYYRVVYIEASKLLLLSSLDDYYRELVANEFCDGIIFDIIKDSPLDETTIDELLEKNSSNIIIRLSDKPIDNYVIEKIKMVFASNELISTKSKLFAASAVESMRILINDAKNQINQYLETYFNNAKCYNRTANKKDLKTCINKSLMDYYPSTVIFNNEQVNKNELSSVSSKARNYVADCILKGIEINVSNTSQEGTIFDSFVNAVGQGPVIELIKAYFVEADSTKTSFDQLINTLVSAPYGIRKGIIPLLLAKAINEISIISNNGYETVIIYNENVEIELNANSLAKIVEMPSRYYFNYAQINLEKLDMFNGLCEIFGVQKETNFVDSLNGLVVAIKRFVSLLPPIIIKSSNRDNVLNLNLNEMSFKNLLLKTNINNYEFIFEELPHILKCDYKDVARITKNIKDGYRRRLASYREKIVQDSKSLFSLNDGSLKASVDLWIAKQKNIDKIIFEDSDKRIYQALLNLNYNDNESVDLIANACVNSTVSDFNVQKEGLYFDALNNFKQIVEDRKNAEVSKNDFVIEDNSYDFSPLGETLYSNLQEDMASYGESITNEEKALVLKKMLVDLLK